MFDLLRIASLLILGLKPHFYKYFFVIFISSDTLWELAAAEVHSRETGVEEEAVGEIVNERTVFMMGSKTGVCSQLGRTTDKTFIAS